MKYKLFLLTVLTLFAINACSKSDCFYVSIPNSLVFIIKKDNRILSDSILNNIKLSYVIGIEKKYVSDVARGINEFSKIGVITSRLIGQYSADDNIKDYTIEYPNGEKDKLFVDYESPSKETGCVYKLNSIKFNGKIAEIDTELLPIEIYRFNR
jgi:hypothetical protein